MSTPLPGRQSAHAKPLRALLTGALFVSLLANGCASYTDETREVRTFYAGDKYQEALSHLDSSGLKDETRNRLLYHLEKASILDRLGERAKSRQELFTADRIADELYTVSVSKTALSFVYNDSTTDYDGEDYEKVAIHTMLALSYLEDQSLKDALIEARKINTKLAEINAKYDSHKNRYGEDGFARYLSAMIYEAQGEGDDAIVDYGKALQLYEGSYAAFTQGGVPESLVASYYRLLLLRNRKDRLVDIARRYPAVAARVRSEFKSSAHTGELVVVHEVGEIAVKKAQDFVLPFGQQVVRFSFPTISQEWTPNFGATGVQINGREVQAEQVQNLNAIARATLEDRRLRLIVKEGARLLAKGQLTDYAYRRFGPLGGIAANIFAVATETADTRSWQLLPRAYYVTRIRLPAGPHALTILNDGRTSRMASVVITPGKITFLRDQG